ncbi:hypothetical protein [Castellaniella sp. UC4442_H9]|jgi:hypothetical protein|nr:hypothetical protein [Castellaniella sp.]
MSAVREAIEALKGTLLLADKVERVAESLKGLSEDLEDHEKRIIRLETKWETALEFSRIQQARPKRD